MKKKQTIVVLTVFLAIGSLLLVLGKDEAKTAVSSRLEPPNIIVRIDSTKQSYIQGEAVALNLEIVNNGHSEVFLKGWDVRSGLLRILVASEDQKFKQYAHSRWNREKPGRFIKPGETIKSQASLLWNFSPVGRVADLSRVKDDVILSDLAFPDRGVYFLKAVLTITGENRMEVESAPVQIVINEPVGDDLRIWNKIKNNSELAYFIQENQIRASKAEEREKVLKEVEQLVSNYSTGILATELKESLEKFRESEAKVKEYMESLKRRQKPSN